MYLKRSGVKVNLKGITKQKSETGKLNHFGNKQYNDGRISDASTEVEKRQKFTIPYHGV